MINHFSALSGRNGIANLVEIGSTIALGPPACMPPVTSRIEAWVQGSAANERGP